MKRITAVIMLLSLCLTAFAMSSCSGNADTGTTAIDTTPAENSGTEEEKLVLPEGMNYDGADFFVLTAGNVAYNDFNYDEDSAGVNAVSEAQYRRLLFMKDEYGVNVKSERKQNGSSYGGGPGYKTISSSVQSESTDFHLGIIGGYDVAALARENYLYDLNSLKWVETSKSWWDQNANNDLTIGDLLLFTNGSLTAAYSESTFAFYFNKDLAKIKLTDEQDPYQLVKDGKWTIDKLGELSRAASEDIDGNNTLNHLDRYGIYTWDDSMIGMVEAAGTKICTVGEDGKVSLTLQNSNTVNAINAYASFAYDNSAALAYQAEMRAGRMTAAEVYAAFGEGRALFWASSTNNLATIRSMDGDFGILPYPKLSEEQERYYSTIAPYNSQFICVPLYLEDGEYVGSVVEALAYHGKELVTPAVYEKTLKGVYSRDEESYEMLDIIYGSYGYDFGLYYRVGMYPDGLLNLLRNKSSAFTSMYEGSVIAAEQELLILNENFNMLMDYWADAE